MSIKEFRDLLNDELKNKNEESSNIAILKAKQELLNDEKNRNENFEILNLLEGHSLVEQISILDTYLNQDNNGINNAS